MSIPRRMVNSSSAVLPVSEQVRMFRESRAGNLSRLSMESALTFSARLCQGRQRSHPIARLRSSCRTATKRNSRRSHLPWRISKRELITVVVTDVLAGSSSARFLLRRQFLLTAPNGVFSFHAGREAGWMYSPGQRMDITAEIQMSAWPESAAGLYSSIFRACNCTKGEVQMGLMCREPCIF